MSLFPSHLVWFCFFKQNVQCFSAFFIYFFTHEDYKIIGGCQPNKETRENRLLCFHCWFFIMCPVAQIQLPVKRWVRRWRRKVKFLLFPSPRQHLGNFLSSYPLCEDRQRGQVNILTVTCSVIHGEIIIEHSNGKKVTPASTPESPVHLGTEPNMT